jgi:hypothetical protein
VLNHQCLFEPDFFFKDGETKMKTVAFGVFLAFVLAGTAAFSQMVGGREENATSKNEGAC